VPIAVALTGVGAFVGSCSYVLGHLRFQHLLQNPLDDLAQEVGLVQQDLLRHLLVHPTMTVGHRRSFPIG
jgi:hypothetical protein